MTVKKGDYFIVQPEDSPRFYLMKAKADAAKKAFPAMVEASKLENKRVTTDVDPKTIVLNLGPKPTIYSTHRL